MILYTVVPLEMVLEGMDQFNPRYEEIDWQGIKLVVEPQGSFQAKIVRLVSPNPRDYLNPLLAPGNVIHFR